MAAGPDPPHGRHGDENQDEQRDGDAYDVHGVRVSDNRAVNSGPAKNRITLPVVLGLGLAALAAGGYFVTRSRHRLPSPQSPVYEEMTRSFYLGLSSLQVGLLDDAKGHFARATTLVPEEPAAWANLGLAHLRLGEFDAASQPVERAVALAPKNGEVVFLQAQLETSRGRLDEGIARFRRAVDLDPDRKSVV